MLDVHVLHLPSDKCPDEPYPSPSNLEKITGNTEQLCVRGNGIRILGSTVLLSRYALTESCGFLLAMYPVVSSWPYILWFLLGHVTIHKATSYKLQPDYLYPASCIVVTEQPSTLVMQCALCGDMCLQGKYA